MSGKDQSPAGRTKLLIVDDDEKLVRLLRDYLQPFGYQVDAVHDGRQGLAAALDGDYAAIILDIMLPGLNGLDLLRELRRESQTPVIMLTALGDEPDRIAGLEIGADDYLPKTFSTRELLARLRAVIRRSLVTSKQRSDAQPAPVSVGGLWIDPATHTATLDDRPLSLTPVEYDMLLALARSAGRVKSREQLLLEIAERDFESFDRSIDVHVSSLRKKLGDDSRSPRFIETVRGAGYRMRRPDSEPVA
ncbi:MAG TPA: response regulator transcription factor [Bryobacteraceae bacterium]|jgi:DNA-binding response OmpR family regulator|nr:response regulator transcription factor [Bryobacteraceae bacterium]